MTPLQEEFANVGAAVMGLGLAAGLLYLVRRVVERATLGHRADARRA